MSRKDNLKQFNDLIDELKQAGERPSIPPTFKTELRGQLLNQYKQSRFSWGNWGQWAGTAVALGVLALIVFISWSSLSQQSGAASAYLDTVDVPDRDEFIVYDQVRIELPMWVEFDPGWAELTAESWQSLDGTFFRGEVVDAEGKQRVFVQGDGQFLWEGTYDSSVDQMETVSLQYFDIYHALAQAEGWAGSTTTPPFYDDLGWDGLVQSILRLDWNCEGLACVNEYLVEPPLGVNSQGGEYEPYGWGVSLVDTETTANGRSLTTYRIDYSPDQDGNTGSQYRLVKLDSDTHTVVEVADYDGETLLRRLKRVSHQLMTSRDLSDDQFTRLPAGLGVSYILPNGRVTAETPLLASPNGEQLAILQAGTQLYLNGLMNNQLAIVQDGTTWQHVSVPDMGDGWVDDAKLQWPLTSDGQLVDLDTNSLPTAVPVQTQLTVLQTYQAELQALLPQTTGEELARLEQVLSEIEAEITRLEQQADMDETAVSEAANAPSFITHHLSAAEVNPGEALTVTLFWEGEPDTDTTIAIHLTDSRGILLSQEDQPYSETMALSLPVPETAADNNYNLVVIPYDSTTGARLDSLSLKEIKVETAVASEPCPCVWLVSATQHARNSVDDPITLTLDLAYQLDSEEEIILKPLYAHPEWKTATDGRLPLDGLGDEIVLDGTSNRFGNKSIAFVENPAVMRSIVGTDFPVVVMQLGYFSEDDNGNNRLNVISMDTMPNFALDLTSTEEISYQMDMSGFETTPGAVVNGTDGNGLTLHAEPSGQDIGILEEGSVVILNDDTLLESDGLLWQSVSTPIGKGWVVADFLEYSEGYTPIETMPMSPDSLWIVKATQLPRSSPDETITLEVTVGYELVTAEEAVLSLSFVHPTWGESLDGYRYLNYNALGDEYVIQSGTGSVTFSATVEPEQITSATNSAEFRLMTRLWALNENGHQTVDPFLISFNQNMSFSVQSLEEITHELEPSDMSTLNLDSLSILDVSPPVGSVLNGRTTFVVTVSYDLASLDTANLNTSLLPASGGAAVLAIDQQIIERGNGELTYSFEFEPLETDEPSAWILDLRLEPAQARPGEEPLVTASPHNNFPDDAYHFEP